MIVLGGWLFADLFLGLVMLFLTANTQGQETPTPTPPATPNLLATSEARAAATQLAQRGALAAIQTTATAEAQSLDATAESARATAAARATQDALRSGQATATAQALLTREAMSADQRATADAQATNQAIQAEATISAFATAQAANQTSVDDLSRQLATAAAQATIDAAKAKATIDAQSTAAAEIGAVATRNASSGANDLATAQAAAAAAQQTAAALQVNSASSSSALATAQAQAASIQATVNALGTAQAVAGATATVLAGQAANTGIDANYTELTVTVDTQGILDGKQSARDAATKSIAAALTKYVSCKVGVGLTFGGGTLEQGLAVSDAVNGLLRSDFPEEFGQAGLENFASVNVDEFNTIKLRLYFVRGCSALKQP